MSTPTYSQCCLSSVRLYSGDEGTNHYICNACNEACDVTTSQTKTAPILTPKYKESWICEYCYGCKGSPCTPEALCEYCVKLLGLLEQNDIKKPTTPKDNLNKTLDSPIDELIEWLQYEPAYTPIDIKAKILKLIQTVGEGLLPRRWEPAEPPVKDPESWRAGVMDGRKQAIDEMETNLKDITGVDRDE